MMQPMAYSFLLRGECSGCDEEDTQGNYIVGYAVFQEKDGDVGNQGRGAGNGELKDSTNIQKVGLMRIGD